MGVQCTGFLYGLCKGLTSGVIMKRILSLSIVMVFAVICGAILLSWMGPQRLSAAEPEEPLRGQRPAPDFPADIDWLNLGDRRLSMADLRGKVVLLDFWTYGCINCIHIIPDLRKLEEKYAEELVVIGVHSAKFTQEGKTENIRRLVIRYDLEHAVANDAEMQVWREFGARAWPTLVLIDPAGNLVGGLSGEGHYDTLDQAIGRVIRTFENDPENPIKRGHLELKLEKDAVANNILLFPGKVLADEAHQRIFISDTSHHRIIVTDLEGKVQQIYGAKNQPALKDGGPDEARFAWPQGLSLGVGEHAADELYVADTENHVIRRIDLKTQQVSTVAGVGQQQFQLLDAGPALTTGINSPWDVMAWGDKIYIAMAGQHQVWTYDPASKELQAFAGSRREELRDGALLRAGLNQPSGLATDGMALYIADSESSSIRKATPGEDGSVETIVGLGLFDFGDRDGVGNRVRLQHPLGVAYWPQGKEGFTVLMADTYNSKLKWLNPESREVRTVAETAGLLDEPGGISINGDHVYIADTNNHAIRVMNLKDNSLRTVVLSDTEKRL